ncbi:MAG TPA: HAD family hydrolase [Pseudogracilibacillus sp.]|nr:HAD family hydrolase [Pseudogracilibacillus sp.]
MLKAIMFDLDDTLLWDEKSVHEAFKSTCEQVVNQYNVDPEALEKRVRYHAKRLYPTYDAYEFAKRIGTGVFEAMWGDYNDDNKDFRQLKEIVPDLRHQSWFYGLKDLDVEDEALAESLALQFPIERKKHVYLYDDTIDILTKLSNQGYPLLMLTNGSADLQQTKLSLSPELAPFFEHIVISGDFGTGKPSIEIFNYALNLLKVEKHEVLMVGDNLMTDILGASRAGIDSAWLNHNSVDTSDVTPTFEIKKLKELLPIVKSLSK